MLRLWQAHAAGFAVQCDDGARIQVPAGPIVLDVPRLRRRERAARGRVNAWLTAIGADWEAESHNGVSTAWMRGGAEVLVGDGDRIEVLSEVRAAADASAPYRGGDGSRLECVGTPVLRLVR